MFSLGVMYVPLLSLYHRKTNTTSSVCIAGCVRLYFTHLYLVSYDVFCTLLFHPIPTQTTSLLLTRHTRARRKHLHNHVRRVRRWRRLRLPPRLQTPHEPPLPARLRQHLAILRIPAPPIRRSCEENRLGVNGKARVVPDAVATIR